MPSVARPRGTASPVFAPRPPFALRLHRICAALALGGLVILAACEEGLTPPVETPALAGSWSGSLVMSAQTYPASFNLTQTGTTVRGTAIITPVLPSSSVNGSIDIAGRLVVVIDSGCEHWFGTLSPSADNQRLSGGMNVERDACPTGANESGSLTMNRQ